jgi:hypothetical protein
LAGNLTVNTGATFTTGAFTGVQKISLKVTGAVDIYDPTGSTSFAVQNSIGRYYLDNYTWYAPSSYLIKATGYLMLSSSGNPLQFSIDNGANNHMRIFTSGNVTIQNGGTYTDAGYRLDVNGTARVSAFGVGITTQNASALLQVDSTTKGILGPRLTTAQILAISTPAEGLYVYNTDLKTLCFYNGTAWQKVTSTAM